MSYRDLGFWRSLGRFPLSQMGAWDIIWAALLAGFGTFFYVRIEPAPDRHVDLVGNYLVVTGPLFGVVLAGFAIVAAMLGDRYVRLLQESGRSTLDIFGHFVVVAGLLMAVIVSVVAYRASAQWLAGVNGNLEKGVFLAVSFLFLYSLFASFELIKLIFGVAVTSTGLKLIRGDEDPSEGEEIEHRPGGG